MSRTRNDLDVDETESPVVGAPVLIAGLWRWSQPNLDGRTYGASA